MLGLVLALFQSSLSFSTEIKVTDKIDRLMLEEQQNSVPNPEITAILNELESHLKKRDFDAALDAAKQLRASIPAHVEFCQIHALVLIGQGQLEHAYSTLESCLKLAPRKPQLHVLSGTVLAAIQNYAQAWRHYSTAIALTPNNADVYLQRAKFSVLYLETDENAQQAALNDLQRFEQMGGDQSQSRSYKARALHALGQAEKALPLLMAAVDEAPDDFQSLTLLLKTLVTEGKEARVDSILNKTNHYLTKTLAVPAKWSQFALVQAEFAKQQGDQRQTEAFYRQAISLDKANLRAVKQFIYWLDKQERLDETIALTQTGLSLVPEDEYLVSYMAWALSDAGKDVKAAYKWLDKAVALSPDNIYLADTRAWLEARQGHYELALQHLQRCLSQAEYVPEIAFHAGFINYKLGNRVAAENYLNLALRQPDSFTGRKEATQLLLSLQQ